MTTNGVTARVTSYAHGIHAVDTDYVRPFFDAAHLVVENGRAAFVDCGTSHSVARLLAALDSLGLSTDAVDWLFLTHVHLDHAGGAGALLRHLPNAKVVVHPRGAAHLVDPCKLVTASIAVYGEALYSRLYGEILPIAAERVVAAEEGECFELSGRRFEVMHTPGHALHHQVFFDERSSGVFTGDTFGLSYREFDVAGHAFALPTTSPTQFDPDQLVNSIRAILARAPARAYLTHYGEITELPRIGASLERQIRTLETLARQAFAETTAEALRMRLRSEVRAVLLGELRRHGCRLEDAEIDAVLAPDIALNADGLIAWLARRTV